MLQNPNPTRVWVMPEILTHNSSKYYNLGILVPEPFKKRHYLIEIVAESVSVPRQTRHKAQVI